MKKSISKQNSLNYINFRCIESQVKKLKQINSNTILSDKTKIILNQLRQSDNIFNVVGDLHGYMMGIQRNMKYLEELYHNNNAIKKINFSYWRTIEQLLYLHLYNSNQVVDLSRVSLSCRVLQEKEERVERGWLIESVDLKYCKYDQGKGCLEIGDKYEGKKITNVLVTLS